MHCFHEGQSIDIVFVIDATGSMGAFISNLKNSAHILSEKFSRAFQKKCASAVSLRMRIIDFADFQSEKAKAINSSKFFAMPEENNAFISYIKNIEFENRGFDLPENAFEAIAVAINSDWRTLSAQSDGYHIVVLVSDSTPLHFGERMNYDGYESAMFPKNVSELENLWNEANPLNSNSRRNGNKKLFLYVPFVQDREGHSWDDLFGWDNVSFNEVEQGKGCAEIDIDKMINDIVAKV